MLTAAQHTPSSKIFSAGTTRNAGRSPRAYFAIGMPQRSASQDAVSEAMVHGTSAA